MHLLFHLLNLWFIFSWDFSIFGFGMYSGQHRSVVRLLGRRYFADAAATEEYTKRNYANNVSEYNTVLGSIIAQRRSSSSPFFGGLWLLIFFFLNTRLFFNLFMYEKGWFLCNVMWSGISYWGMFMMICCWTGYSQRGTRSIPS